MKEEGTAHEKRVSINENDKNSMRLKVSAKTLNYYQHGMLSVSNGSEKGIGGPNTVNNGSIA